VKVIGGYALQQKLGSGSFATVYKGVRVAHHADDNALENTVAIKAITRASEKLTKKVMENLELEIRILRTYRHPNIVCLHDVQKTERHFYLILEYCGGGDLQRLIRSRKNGRLSERLTRRLMRDLSAGLKFLWGQELIHRDIKPQNLLLTGPLPLDEKNDPAQMEPHEELRRKANFPSDRFALKIADFGFARHLQDTSLAETLCGSPLYMAPEILQHQRYDAKADLWSVGTVLFEMVSGRPPFNGENHMDLLRNIQRKAVRLPPDVKVTPQCVNLLRLLLNRNPLSRAGFEQFFQASDAFVSLGCEGKPLATPAASTQNFSSRNLGPIPEATETNSRGAASMETVATAYPAQRRKSANYRQTTAPSHVARSPNPQTFAEPPTPPPPLHLVSPPLGPTDPVPRSLQQGFPPQPMLGNVNYPQGQISHAPSRANSFIPLQASPPLLKHPSSTNLPPPLTLDNRMQSSDRHGSSSSSVDDSEFVMVDYGSGLSQGEPDRNLSMPQRMLLPPAARQGSTPVKSIPFAQTLTSRYSTKQQLQDNFRCRGMPRGMLSTSPRTGGAVIGMNGPSMLPVSTSVEQTKSFVATQHESATRILSAAEDVGRRAVQVAHLGDSRVYLAMRSVAMGESTSSVITRQQMNIVEESGTSQPNLTATSTLSGVQQSTSEDPDEEMPFALTINPTATNAATSTRFPSRQEDSSVFHKSNMMTTTAATTTVETMKRPSLASIMGYLNEALSLYVKSLQMLKGSVSASQNVLNATKASLRSSVSSEDHNRANAFIKRCEVSANWLSIQFSGVLERAEAATGEVGKLKSSNVEAVQVASLEQLIYDRSMKMGRDGAVKQLLGQFDSARSCYRSAGLLAETLLMEPNLGATDREVLEGYVDGFAERIIELDRTMHEERNGAVEHPGGSDVVGLVGGSHMHRRQGSLGVSPSQFELNKYHY